MGNRRAQLICAWSGPACAVLFIIGAVFLGHFIPPLVAPSDSAQVVAAKYAEHSLEIRLGALITIISMSLVATWGVSVAAQTRRTEGSFPILTYVQLMCVAVGTAVIVLMSMFWAQAAFRPDTATPESVQQLNDTAYFLLLFTWPPFAIWSASVALAIFLDPNKSRPVFPRWVGYLSVWVTLLFFPAGTMAFFKTGVFAWNGLVALYIPVIIFFVWLLVLTRYTIVNINDGYFHSGEPAPRAGLDELATHR